MSKPKFTSGPWHKEWVEMGQGTHCNGYFDIRDEDGGFVATLGDSEDEHNPDAALIATAPEMYRAMIVSELLLRAIRSYLIDNAGDADILLDVSKQIERLEVIEKKSRGEDGAEPLKSAPKSKRMKLDFGR